MSLISSNPFKNTCTTDGGTNLLQGSGAPFALPPHTGASVHIREFPLFPVNSRKVEARSVLSLFVPPTLSRRDLEGAAEIFKLVRRTCGSSGREDHPRAGRVRVMPFK